MGVGGKMKGLRSEKVKGGKALGDDLTIDEHEGEMEVTPGDLNRALDLVARWALRRGQKVLEEADVEPENLVTCGNIKGYGGMNGWN